MANKKRNVYKPKPMTENKRNIIQGLFEEYDIETADDIQDALKDLLSGTIQEMLEAEMDNHLGYEKYERSSEPNYRNGTKSKGVRSKYGEFEVDVPQDRQSTFSPKVLPKRKKDISSIDEKIISMYAKGMSTRQILDTIEDIQDIAISAAVVALGAAVMSLGKDNIYCFLVGAVIAAGGNFAMLLIKYKKKERAA